MKLVLAPGSAPPKLEASCHFNDLRFEVLQYGCGLQLPMHTHEQVFLDFCLEGTVQECWSREQFVRGPASLNLIPADTPHGNHHPEGSRSFQIVLTTPWLARFRQIAALNGRPVRYQKGLPVWIAARMYREFQRHDNLTPLVLEGMLLELLAEISRDRPHPVESGSPRWLRQTRDFLHAHFTESFSIETLAAAVGVHPSHLMRGFRQHCHSTIGDYVRQLRVEYACHLLSASDFSLAQIAVEAGFTDQSHLSRTFKACTGMTPTEFQKDSEAATLCQKVIGRYKTARS